MTTMTEARKARQKQKHLDTVIGRWKTWTKEASLPRTSVNSGERSIRKSGRPTATMKALQREFANRPAAPEPEPEHIDYSDRTEKLANVYRKNAPAMQEADLKSETAASVKPPKIRLRTSYNPEAEFEPIPVFLRRVPPLHDAEEVFRKNTTSVDAESYLRTMQHIRAMLLWPRSELVATANGTKDPEIFWAAVSVVKALDDKEESDNGRY